MKMRRLPVVPAPFILSYLLKEVKSYCKVGKQRITGGYCAQGQFETSAEWGNRAKLA